MGRRGYNYAQFSVALAKVWATFPVLAALLASLVDAVLISIAAFMDFRGYPNVVGHFIRGADIHSLTLLAMFLVHLVHQLLSALFATLSFVVAGRVVLWWMIATAPLVVYKSGFSAFAERYWYDGSLIPRMTLPRFVMLLGIQIFVVVVCWMFVRGVRRPPLRLWAIGIRGGVP